MYFFIHPFTTRSIDQTEDSINSNSNRNSVSHTKTSGPTAWWKLKLQEYSFIKRIDIYNRRDCCGARLNGIRVFVGDTLIFTVHYEADKNPYSYPGLNLKGSEITIRGGSEVLALAEVQVYGYSMEKKIKDGNYQTVFPDLPALSIMIFFSAKHISDKT